MDIRILVTGDRFSYCYAMAAGVLRRLVERYESDIMIVHGDATGVDESFGTATKGLGVTVEPYPTDWYRLGKRAVPIRNGEVISAGAGFCIVAHHFLMNGKGTKGCDRQETDAGIRTNPIDSEKAGPERVRAVDLRLE